MEFVKGQSGNKRGRPKGAKNKIPTNIVERILFVTEELEKSGKGLSECAQSDPAWFYTNFLKGLIPKNIDVNLDGELKITWEK